MPSLFGRLCCCGCDDLCGAAISFNPPSSSGNDLLDDRATATAGLLLLDTLAVPAAVAPGLAGVDADWLVVDVLFFPLPFPLPPEALELRLALEDVVVAYNARAGVVNHVLSC